MRWLAAFALPLVIAGCAGGASTHEGPVAQHDQAAVAAFDSWLVIDGTSTPVQIAASDPATNEITLRLSASMGRPIKDWIEASLASNHVRKSGELKTADFTRSVRQIREFENALITEIGFPSADAAAKDASFLTLKLAATVVRNRLGDGSKVENPSDMAQKAFHPTDFRFRIAGLEACENKIAKVDAIVLHPTVESAKEPGKIDFPNLRFTAEGAECIAALETWRETQASDPGASKSGSLVYLNRTRQKDLLALTFSGLGIFKDTPAPFENNDDRPDGGVNGVRYTLGPLFAFTFNAHFPFGDESGEGEGNGAAPTP